MTGQVKPAWWELRIPMRIFLPLLFLDLTHMGIAFFIFNLTNQLIVHFDVSPEIFSWPQAASYLLSTLNCVLLPSLRAFVTQKQLLGIYIITSFVGTILLTAAMWTQMFSLWIPGSLLLLGIGFGGATAIVNSVYASRCTSTECVPKVFAISTFASGLIQ